MNAYFSKVDGFEFFPKLEKNASFDWQVGLMCYEHYSSVWVERIIDLDDGRGKKQKSLRMLALDHKNWNVEIVTNLENRIASAFGLEEGIFCWGHWKCVDNVS